jgi:hypothetical protein
MKREARAQLRLRPLEWEDIGFAPVVGLIWKKRKRASIAEGVADI